MTRSFRPGAIGALMDETERAAEELLGLLEKVSPERYEEILDPETEDEDGRSIRTILAHVVRSAHGYADYLRDFFGMARGNSPAPPATPVEAAEAVRSALAYTEETLRDHWEMTDEQAVKVVVETRWGGRYDIEQLLEHGVVHILRHRRQIEKLFAGREKG